MIGSGYFSPVLLLQNTIDMKSLIFLFSAVIIVSSTLIGCDQDAAVQEQTAVTQKKPDLPYGKATRYGLFKERGRGRVVEVPDASTGKVIRGSTLEFVEEENTDRVPLRKGVRFGYRYWLKFPPEQKQPSLKRILIHPEMTLPDGSKVSHSERTITRKASHGIVTAIDAYALSEDYELVEGEWTFQLWYNEHKLVEQKFITFIPFQNFASRCV